MALGMVYGRSDLSVGAVADSSGPGLKLYNWFICAQNGFIGYPVSKKIELPAKWEELRISFLLRPLILYPPLKFGGRQLITSLRTDCFGYTCTGHPVSYADRMLAWSPSNDDHNIFPILDHRDHHVVTGSINPPRPYPISIHNPAP